MRFEIERARRLYEVADQGIDYIPRGRRFPVVVARELYAAILDRIEAQQYAVFSRRAQVSRPAKLLVAARCAASDPGEIADRIRYRRTAPAR
jgi:phytoene synthase